MPDDVAGAIDRLRADVRDDFGHVREIVNLQLAALDKRVTTLETAQATEATERRATRRWLIGAVAVPSLMMLVTIILTIWSPR